MFDSFTKHHFDPPDIGRVNDYAIQITQLYCVSIVIDPCGILNIELAIGWIQRPFFWPTNEPPAVDKVQHNVCGIRSQYPVPLA